MSDELVGGIGIEITRGIGDDEVVPESRLHLSAQAAVSGPFGREARMVLADALLEEGTLVVRTQRKAVFDDHLERATACMARRALVVTMRQS